ncbi:hypothetical protein A6P39_000915 [Streptomyces sp. FXJ1.172]|uniref:hypothetical protein n=1 Tax=Streptomyces sp. FXJ1.172 TaxID=710705 RepID=UPI0007CF1C29|nr:hypothetical protein [Streptomyces sp. FXJ1.172]WEO92794.1 hypothetical protein A6P39_000915 [Streptomyces sp. FXJ1.172]
MTGTPKVVVYPPAEDGGRRVRVVGGEYNLQWARCLKAAVTAHAEASREDRLELEQAAKKAVRHAEGDPAG